MFSTSNFEDIIQKEFAFLVSESGFTAKTEKEHWLQKVIFSDDEFEIEVELGDKDLYFNVLVFIQCLSKSFPLWAICKAEKVNFGSVAGSIAENNQISNLVSNSTSAIKFLLPKMSNYGRTEKRKIERILSKQLKQTIAQGSW